MPKRSGDEAELENAEGDARGKKVNRSPAEVYNIVSPYLLDPEQLRNSARDLGNLKVASRATLEGVEWTTGRADYIDRIDRLGRIGDQLCDIMFTQSNRMAARWVDSSILGPKPPRDPAMHKSFSLGQEIGMVRCIAILKPMLPLMSDDNKSIITNRVTALFDVEDQTKALSLLKEPIGSFKEEEQGRLVDAASRTIRNTARSGNEIEPACQTAIAFIASVERAIGSEKPELKNKIERLFKSHSQGRDNIAQAISAARASVNQPVANAQTDAGTARVSPFIQHEISKITGVDIDRDIDQLEKTINKALSQSTGTSRTFPDNAAYAADLAYATGPTSTLCEKAFEDYQERQKPPAVEPRETLATRDREYRRTSARIRASARISAR